MTNAEARKLKIAQSKTNAKACAKRCNILSTETAYDTFKCKLSILMEDDGYAFDYVESFCKTVYPFLDVQLIGAHGQGCVHYLIDEICDADVAIVIYDKSQNIKIFQRINDELKKLKMELPDTRIWGVTPKSFEEVILSFLELDKVILNLSQKAHDLLDLIHDYTKGQREDYSLSNFVLNEGRVTDENILEDWMEQITRGTKYECTHRPSYLSECWTKECTECTDKQCNEQMNYNVIGNYMAKSKSEYLALNSLSYALSKIIDMQLGYSFRQYKAKIANEKNLFEEVK